MRLRVSQLSPAWYLALVFFNLLAAAPTRAQDPLSLPAGRVGTPYSAQIKSEGGMASLSWRVSSGQLPPGLAVSSAGKVDGTPAAAAKQPFTFELTVSDSSEPPQIATQVFSIMIGAPPLRIVGMATVSSTAQLKIVGANVINSPGDSAPATSAGLDADPPAPAVTSAEALSSGSPTPPTEAPKTGSQPPPDPPQAAAPATQKLSKAATDDNLDSSNESSKDWEARAIAGYHQAGASSAKFAQNFFFDFFVMRALSEHHLWEKEVWNLWGDVRIASFPQQIATPVGTFVSAFGTQVSNLPVNQLAQSADFQTGLEYPIKSWERPGNTARMLGLVGYVGAMGTFQPPDAQMQIFDVPDLSSLQYKDFIKTYPQATNAKYVGFIPPNRERFYRNYGFGVRVTTFDKNPSSLAPPATYMLSFGQDEAITSGHLTSVVGKVDVFYPLPLSFATKDKGSMTPGAYKFLFLFGTANLRLSKAANIPAFALQNPNATSTTVQPFDPALAVITAPSTRDTYRFGVGVDLVNLMQSIKPPSQ